MNPQPAENRRRKRMNFLRNLSVGIVLSCTLAACAGNLGSSTQSSALPAVVPNAGATGVVVTVVNNTTPLAGIKVDLYTGTLVKSCPPFGHECVKKIKQLANGTTAKNGKVTLNATFTSSEIVCAEAIDRNTTVQVCKRPFQGPVTLDFK
jgi:hypothetical protein